ncbi:hypothetical protein [Bradyrhizobium vignae]|uniref:Transposase n=1 Tax=Bradyrhizobium vignae TaxID=1549949 RepID=A0A2U3Q9B2_9BRAD|nr:protein of unknown function [Bradyrhizobium vignae]
MSKQAKEVLEVDKLEAVADRGYFDGNGSKKAVNNRDRNFTHAKMARRMAQIEESVGRYLRQLDSADRQEPSEAISIKTTRIKEKIARLKQEMSRLEVLDAPAQAHDVERQGAAPLLVDSGCQGCAIKSQLTLPPSFIQS